MADKLVAVRIKQQNNTYSNEIPIGAKAENVAYDNTKNLLTVLGTIDMDKGNVQDQLDALLQSYFNIEKDITGAIDDWIEENIETWSQTHDAPLDPTLSEDNMAPQSSAVPTLIAVNGQTESAGTKLRIRTSDLEDLTVLIPSDIDDTLTQMNKAANAKATGDAIAQLAAEAAYKDMIAPYVEDTMTASQAYNAGDYICVNTKLYRTTTAIVSGLALVVGTNVAEVTIADELNTLRSDISYTPIAISSFTSNVTQAEIGSTVNSVTLSYTLNKVPTTLKLDGNNITPAVSGSQILTNPLTANKTWTLAATDSGSSSESPHSTTKTVTLSFLNKVYYGVKATGTINSAFVTSLSGKDFATSKAKTFTITTGANQYIWYACPTSFGQCTFKVGGFDGGFEPAQTISLTNESGHTENYYVYRSTNANLGATTVIVS